MLFVDRRDAGRKIVSKLKGYDLADPVVFGIPRGGIVCAHEVAHALQAPLYAVVVRKIGHPENPEYAIGAVAEDGCLQLTAEAEQQSAIWLEAAVDRERHEARRRQELYMSHQTLPILSGKTALIVDDGLATGLTMLVAIEEIKHLNPARIVVAVPVGEVETILRVDGEVDETVVVQVPANMFGGIGNYYRSFDEVTDEEVLACLRSGV